ncbi:MAG TPA: hypothetical protein VLG76_01190 [Rhabdochlamydiaceae bacterium]|nr:hypothetical protein [Rhabdochlamydiaceae bacterium]
MAEPVKVQKVVLNESALRELSKQIQQPTKEFIDAIQRIREKPSLVDDPIQLGHFAKSIIDLNDTTKIAKSLE